MQILANAKRNATEKKDANLAKKSIFEYFDNIERGVNNLIEDINENL